MNGDANASEQPAMEQCGGTTVFSLNWDTSADNTKVTRKQAQC
jgi:hypothetical protein